jgi:hypothetical protein
MSSTLFEVISSFELSKPSPLHEYYENHVFRRGVLLFSRYPANGGNRPALHSEAEKHPYRINKSLACRVT